MHNLKKALLAIAVIAAIPLFHTLPIAADRAYSAELTEQSNVKTYTADFEEESDWLYLETYLGTADEYTDPAAVTVTKAYGGASDNQAAFIRSYPDDINVSKTYTGRLTSRSNGTLASNPLSGRIRISFDFMIDSALMEPQDDWNSFTFSQIYGSDGRSRQLINFLKASGGRGFAMRLSEKVSDINVTYAEIASGLYLQGDTWTRAVIIFDPTTGVADYTIITNVDKPVSEQTVCYYNGWQMTDPNQWSSVNRIVFNVNRSGVGFYIDNVTLSEIPSLALSSITPSADATDVAADSGIRLVFEDEVTDVGLFLNGKPIDFEIDDSKTVLTYSEELIANREYTLSGIVTASENRVCDINHSFRTAPEMELISSTVKNGDRQVPITDTLVFEFNHRIDPCDNSFSVTGGAEIESYTIKGSILEIKLTKVLEYDTYYTVKLDGLGDLYSEEYFEPHITFKTAGLDVNYARFVDADGESLSVIDSANTRYTAEFINNALETIDIIFVMTLTKDDRMKEIVFTPYSVAPGDKLNIDEGFTIPDTQTGDYQIKVFYLDSLETLSPYDTQMLPVNILGEQSDM